jgi:hypothetical protein
MTTLQVRPPDKGEVTLSTNLDRAATASITGYAYQFDLTTLEILASSDNAAVTVEGCEDIDLDNGVTQEAVQCKYLSAAKYSLAGLRKPILPMLKAFSGGLHINYRLYVYYGDAQGLPVQLTLDELKKSLTEVKRSSEVIEHFAGIEDAVLQDFLNHFTIQSGKKFDHQQEDVCNALHGALDGTIDDVRDLHYANAVTVIMELAMRTDKKDRVITRPEFVERLNKRPAMYTRWHKELVGVERFQKLLKRRLQSAGLLAATRRRLIVLESPMPSSDNSLVTLAQLIQTLGTTMYGPGKLSSAKPWTAVIEASAGEVVELKRQLIRLDVAYNDGYEKVLFSPRLFDRDPTINTHRNSKKIEQTSYDVRVVTAETYRAHKAELRPSATIISFATSPAGEYADPSSQTLDAPGWRTEDILKLLEIAK